MTPLVALLATNAVLAVPLALLAWLAERGLRRPGVAHALWALALLKLVTPPLLPVPVVPAAAPSLARAAQAGEGGPAVPGEPTAAPATSSSPVTPGEAAGGVVAAGAALVLALAFVRGRRFLRLVSDARAAPPDDQARLRAVASRMGVGAPVALELVDARVPPLLWAGARGPRLLLAEELRAQLSPAELEAVLAHELAHLRRRDHWMRAAELGVAALFWWYPLAWWVRRRLRAAEERCCDEWVLRTLPDGARDYARALVKSAGFASSADALPAGASGAVGARDLELRIRRILMSRPTRLLSRPWRLLLAGLAGIVLAALPIRAQDPKPPETTGNTTAAEPSREGDRREAELQEQRRALEAQRRELEATRAEVEAARSALERERRGMLDAHEAARARYVRKIEAARAADSAKAAHRAMRAEAAAAALAAKEVQRAVAAAHSQAVRDAIRASADALREGSHAHAQAIREAMKATTEAHARAVREAVRASSEAHAQALGEAMRTLAAELSELSRQNRLGPEVIERIKAEIERMREAVEGTEHP